MTPIMHALLTKRWLWSSVGILLALLLAASLAIALLPTHPPHVLAATAQQATKQTCAQKPTRVNCEQQDPQWQGCATDATSAGTGLDILQNGVVVGRVERRFSQRCHAWWGRVFDERPGVQTPMALQIGGRTFTATPAVASAQCRLFFSPMVFDATPTQPAPAVTGILDANQPSSPSATIQLLLIDGNNLIKN